MKHLTTKEIPVEIHRGRLLNRTDDIAPEEEEKIISYKRQQALERTTIAAEKSTTCWNRNACVKNYTVGDKVWVRQRIPGQRKGVIWQREASIHEVKRNATYRLLWGTTGGYDITEKAFSVSLRVWSGNDLKLRIERDHQPSDSESDSEFEIEGGEKEVIEKKSSPRENTPPKKKRIVKRRRKQEEKGARKEEKITSEVEEGPEQPPKRQRVPLNLAQGHSLSAAFAEISVEKVDGRSVTRAKKAESKQ
jgi:hypothetical protein